MAGLDPLQLRDYVVRPALATLGLLGGEPIERLVMGTAAHESDGFRYIHQLGKGPALSPWQIEPATATDAVERCTEKTQLVLRGLGLPSPHSEDWLEWGKFLPGNLYLSAAMCRLIYYYKPFRIEELGKGEPENLARIWKRCWNTVAGAGTEAQFLANWRRYLGDLYTDAGG